MRDSKSPSERAVALAERAFTQDAEAKIVNQEVAADSVKRDANTARLKGLRLERDRLEAESPPPAPVRKPAPKKKP